MLDQLSQQPTRAVDVSWSLAYRRDIDGLRAVAVGSVFLFHLKPTWMPGGFVGVDVFFVISGYLITSILMQDLHTGRIGLMNFYQRRIARLLPAMLTVVTGILVCSWAFHTSQDFASAGASSIAALLSFANLKFFVEGNYFEISRDARPFLHFWSLSVEEQYYMIYPLILIALTRYRTATVGVTIAGITALSFTACVIITFINPKAAFYLLPFRSWELGLGGTAAFVAQGVWGGSWVRGRREMALVGFSAIMISFALFNEGMGFPGYAAALPVLGTAALLIAGHYGDYPGRTLLSAKPMVAVGKVSYTLYLWHWPVFSFVDYALFSEPEWLRLGLKIAISVGLTMVTYVVIEKPARRSLNLPYRRLFVFSGFAAAIALFVPLGLTIRSHNYVNASSEQVADGGRVFPGPKGAANVVLIGDSNASMYATMLRDLSRDRGYALYVASSGGGDARPNPDGTSSALWSASAALIGRLEPDVVVISNSWAAKLGEDRSKLDLALDYISRHAGRIVILNQPPTLPTKLSRAGIREGNQPPFFEDVEKAEKRKSVNAYLATFASETISVVDVASSFIDADGQVLFTDGRGRLLYHDSAHLSGYGANKLRSQVEGVIEQ